jgi:hypothetical protein
VLLIGWLVDCFNKEREMERCVYCGELRGGSFSCCGEVHFEDDPLEESAAEEASNRQIEYDQQQVKES